MPFSDFEVGRHREIADLGAKWLSNIEQMTTDLATVLDEYLQGYEFDDGPNGIVIFRPRADLGERSKVFAGHDLGVLFDALRLVNSHRPDIPFPESILGNLYFTSWEGPSWETDEVFTKSVCAYMGQLDILASYQQMIHVLSNQGTTAVSETHSKVERMASIRAIMEQNPTWINGKRQLILDELKRREKAKGIRRPGVRKNTGLKMIEQIISEQK